MQLRQAGAREHRIDQGVALPAILRLVRPRPLGRGFTADAPRAKPEPVEWAPAGDLPVAPYSRAGGTKADDPCLLISDLPASP